MWTPAAPHPLPTPDSYDTPQDTTLVVATPGILANDSHPPGVAFFQRFSCRMHRSGWWTLSSNGGFQFMNRPRDTPVPDSFIYHADDGTAQRSAHRRIARGLTPPPHAGSLSSNCSFPGGDQYRIEWTSSPEQVYTIEGTTALPGGWQPIVTDIPATPPMNTYVVNRPSQGFEFFRVSEGGRQGVFINEFMASSSSAGLEDPDEPGEYPDWIELYNNTPAPIDISGWYLTDDLNAPDQFQLPSGVVPALGFLLLYADDDPEQGPDHLGFKLSASGEAIGVSADGVTFVDSLVFGAQTQDESFGRFPDGSTTWTFMTNASPDSANLTGFLAEVADTKFSVDRGFFTSPFTVAITSETTDADIYYTTDFSEPSPANGLLYTNVITISDTTCLRAAAFKSGWKSTDVDTHTYIFVDGVLTQSSNQPGLPSEWNVDNGVFPPYALYGMDPTVVGAYPWHELTNALQSIPSVSIVTEPDNLYHPDTGIYTQPEQRDLAGERPCSVEWIQPDGSPGIGVNCALRIQGNWARMFAKKRPFRLLFKSEYGPSELNYPVFGADESATDTFNTIVLRSNIQGDPETQTEDVFARRMVMSMGIPQSHGTYVHLYVNGLYWGLYNPSERPMAAFCEEYMGGEREDWDSHNANGQGGAVDGTLASWNAMNAVIDAGVADNVSYQKIQGNNPDRTPNPAYPRYLNVADYIDYILFNFWGSVADWPKAGDNWYGARYRPEETTGYKWFIWDAEAAFNTGNETAVTEIPVHAHAALKLNPEYLLQFGDHTHRHLFNDGVLTAENALGLYAQVMGEVAPFIMLEEARWSGWTNPWNGNKWISKAAFDGRVGWITNNYLPNRTAIVIDQFRTAGLYPQTDAPVFRIDGTNQHGGSLVPGGMLSMTNTTSDPIYYTLDGTDPREYGTGNALGALFTADVPLGRTIMVKARSFSPSTGWSAVNEAVFTLDTLSPLRVTEIMYHPRAPQAGTVETNYAESDFEFVELKNTGGSVIGLPGLAFVEGVRFDFSETSLETLAPGEIVVLVRNLEAFTHRYPNGPNLTIAGTYRGRFHRPVGSLSNGGEQLRLVDGLGRDIHAFDYEDDWFPSTDGEGYSLTVIDPLAGTETWDSKLGWRHSASIDGSPGEDDSGSVTYLPGTIVINEAMTHQDTDPPGDWIELHNTTTNAINIGNWYLSDDPLTLTAFKIDAGVVIPGGGYLTFTEAADFGPSVLGSSGFALSEHGETIYLSAGDGVGLAEPAYRESVTFGAAENDVTFGRYVKQDGRADFTAMSATTMNASNAYPLVGPVVIREIMYNPTNGHFEFVELQNISGSAVNLFDPVYPVNRWELSGLDFVFPPVSSIAPGEIIIVTDVDAQVFRNLYGLPGSQQVFGPYAGSLDNGGEALELLKPGSPDEMGVPYIVVDRVKYDNQLPWPLVADGQGASLERVVPSNYGNDVVNWQASALVGGTPGGGAASPAIAPDLDGMPDEWEVEHFGSSLAAAAVDSDGDEASNYAEYVAGTDPTDPASVLKVEIRHANGLQVVVSPLLEASGSGYQGLSRVYDLEWSDSLSPDSWTGVPGYTNLPGSSGSILYPVPVQSAPGYYRCNVRLSE